MEYIYVVKETTKFNYGEKMFEKNFYYKTIGLAYKAKNEFEFKERKRVSKSKEISNIPYVKRTADEIFFYSSNNFYKTEYSVLSEPIITEVLEETQA